MDGTMGLRRIRYFILFLKGENAILILRSNVSKEQNKKTNMFSQKCQVHM